MQPIDTRMHEIRRRFVKGLLHGMGPGELRAYVTGIEEGAEERAGPIAQAA